MEIVIAALILIAAVYVLYRGIRTTNEHGCSSCSTCSATKCPHRTCDMGPDDCVCTIEILKKEDIKKEDIKKVDKKVDSQ